MVKDQGQLPATPENQECGVHAYVCKMHQVIMLMDIQYHGRPKKKTLLLG